MSHVGHEKDAHVFYYCRLVRQLTDVGVRIGVGLLYEYYCSTVTIACFPTRCMYELHTSRARTAVLLHDLSRVSHLIRETCASPGIGMHETRDHASCFALNAKQPHDNWSGAMPPSAKDLMRITEERKGLISHCRVPVP